MCEEMLNFQRAVNLSHFTELEVPQMGRAVKF
jgi:hypothetical protein